MKVIIGMDPHKRSATIEVVDERGQVLMAARYTTDTAGHADMLAAGRRYTERVWAIEGCNGIGRHLAHRLVHDGETPRACRARPLEYDVEGIWTVHQLK
jgi:transposase